MDCRVKPGNDDVETRSRGAPWRPSFAKRRHVKREAGREKPIEGWRLVVSLRYARFAKAIPLSSSPPSPDLIPGRQ
jgi:hypothetical protein